MALEADLKELAQELDKLLAFDTDVSRKHQEKGQVVQQSLEIVPNNLEDKTDEQKDVTFKKSTTSLIQPVKETPHQMMMRLRKENQRKQAEKEQQKKEARRLKRLQKGLPGSKQGSDESAESSDEDESD